MPVGQVPNQVISGQAAGGAGGYSGPGYFPTSASTGSSRNFSQQASRGENYGYHWNTSEGQSTSSNEAQNTSDAYSTGSSRSVQDPELLRRYDQQYRDYVSQHGRIYGDVMSGYADTLGRMQGQGAQIQAGYGALQGQVLGQLEGVDRGRRQEIDDAYAMSRGRAASDLVRRGIGGTTVRSSVDRGLQYDREKALTALAAQTGQQRAGYMADLGSRSMGAQQQLMGQYGSLGGQYMGTLASQNFQLPGWAPNQTFSDSRSQSQSQGTSEGQSQSTNSSYGQGEQWGLNQSYGTSMGGSNNASGSQQPYYPGGGYPPGSYQPPPPPPGNPGGTLVFPPPNYGGDPAGNPPTGPGVVYAGGGQPGYQGVGGWAGTPWRPPVTNPWQTGAGGYTGPTFEVR